VSGSGRVNKSKSKAEKKHVWVVWLPFTIKLLALKERQNTNIVSDCGFQNSTTKTHFIN